MCNLSRETYASYGVFCIYTLLCSIGNEFH
jgi:hypothetical protein